MWRCVFADGYTVKEFIIDFYTLQAYFNGIGVSDESGKYWNIGSLVKAERIE